MSDIERELEIELEKSSREKQAVLRYERMVHATQKAVERLRAFIKSHPFPDKESEIRYFKKMAPGIYGRLFYYQKIHQLELYRQYSSPETLIRIMEQETSGLSTFFFRYSDFIQYFFLNAGYRDEELFTRGGRKISVWQGHEIEAVIDEDFCLGAYLSSCIICNGLYRDWLMEAVAELREPGSRPVGQQKKRLPLAWKGSTTDLVEAINGMHLAGSFGDLPLKQVVEWFEEAFDMDLGHFYNTFQEIARRKKSRTKYLDLARDKLLKKMDQELES